MNHQVVEERVERVDIQAAAFRSRKAFLQFQVEDQVAKPLTLDQIVGSYREHHTEERGGKTGS